MTLREAIKEAVDPDRQQLFMKLLSSRLEDDIDEATVEDEYYYSDIDDYYDDDCDECNKLAERLIQFCSSDVIKKWHITELSDIEEEFCEALIDRFESQSIEPIAWKGDEHVKPMETLVSMGIAEVVVKEGDSHAQVGFSLTPEFVRDLYEGREDLVSLGPAGRYAEILFPKDLKRKELYFSGETREQIETLEKVLSGDNLAKVMARQGEKNRPNGLLYLFSGEPGTGKTEEVKQLSIISGRPLVVADASKLNGTWNGESEKSYKGLFRALRYLCALSRKAPILLFNEADGIICKRDGDAHSSCGRLNNTIQSIMLQELEVFNGVFIATTNLANAIDPAFMNRFADKIVFSLPGADTRTSIWKSQLPQLDPEFAGELGRKYVFSGRSIQNIASKCDTDEILKGEFPSRERIIQYCDTEARSQTHYEKTSGGGENPRCRIGFMNAIG